VQLFAQATERSQLTRHRLVTVPPTQQIVKMSATNLDEERLCTPQVQPQIDVFGNVQKPRGERCATPQGISQYRRNMSFDCSTDEMR
jgi:hypothetical protein